MESKQALETICKGVAGPLKDQARELATNVLFMSDKLSETMEDARMQPMVIEYDNGGGQTGTRKNPIFDAYAQLFSAYLRGLSQLESMIGESVGKDENVTNALEAMRAKVVPLKAAAND